MVILLLMGGVPLTLARLGFFNPVERLGDVRQRIWLRRFLADHSQRLVLLRRHDLSRPRPLSLSPICWEFIMSRIPGTLDFAFPPPLSIHCFFSFSSFVC